MLEISTHEIFDPKDDLTSITYNDYSSSVVSIVEDDVGSINGRRYSPPERDIIIKADKPNYIYDADYSIDNEEMDVDKYDLEKLDQNNWGEKSIDDDDVVTVIQDPRYSQVIITKHETDWAPDSESSQVKYKVEEENKSVSSTSSFQIGKQITQLAKRIESLGNLSRVYDTTEVPHECIKTVNVCHTSSHTDCHCHSLTHQQPLSINCSQHNLNVARDIDSIERVQKRQESMQVRLMNLAKKLNDSAKTSEDLLLEKQIQTEGTEVKKKTRKNGKHKKSKQPVDTKSTHSFMSEILNQLSPSPIEDPIQVTPRSTDEQQLRGSNYYLPFNGGSSTDRDSVNNKYFNQELDMIRQEFRDQVKEIRHLLSERYQQDAAVIRTKSPELLSQKKHECAANCHHNRPCSPVRHPPHHSHAIEPCPLDKYMGLEQHVAANTVYLPSLDTEYNPSLRPGILPSVARAIKNKHRLISDPIEAEKFLNELATRRANLENNIRAIERNKQSEFMYTLLKMLQGNEDSVEIARIQAMIDDCINSSNPEIQNQVQKEFQVWLIKREEQKQKQIEEIQAAELEAKSKSKLIPSKSLKMKYTPPIKQQQSILCKKYQKIQPKIDSGLIKPKQTTKTTTSLLVKATKPETVPVIQDVHPTWSNRRRHRKPYLHFMNDIKLAKKAITPLGDYSDSKSSPPSSRRQKSTKVTQFITDDGDDILPLGYRQYSLDYAEPQKEYVKEQTKETPRTQVKSTSVSPRNPQKEYVKEQHKETPRTQVKSTSVSPRNMDGRPGSPCFSESGVGVEMGSGRGERLGPVEYRDPLDSGTTQLRLTRTIPVSTITNKQPHSSDLRRMIEEALLSELGDGSSPSRSRDQSITDHSISIHQRISTPHPTHVDLDSSHTLIDVESTMLPTDQNGMLTPDATLQHSISKSRISTPTSPRSKSISQFQPVQPTIQIGTQTVNDQAQQTCDDRAVQTARATPTQTPRPQSIKSNEPDEMSIYSDPIEDTTTTDTIPESFSDGMWFMNRSFGEVAPHPIEPITRWKIGPTYDVPTWPYGTHNILQNDRGDSPISDGEFINPTLPGLIPTQDPVLQVIQKCYHGTEHPNILYGYDDDDNDEPFEYLNKHRTPRETINSMNDDNDSAGLVECEHVDDESFSVVDDENKSVSTNQNHNYNKQRPPLTESQESGILNHSSPPLSKPPVQRSDPNLMSTTDLLKLAYDGSVNSLSNSEGLLGTNTMQQDSIEIHMKNPEDQYDDDKFDDDVNDDDDDDDDDGLEVLRLKK